MSAINLVFILSTVFLTSVGQLVLKIGVDSISDQGIEAKSYASFLIDSFTSPLVIGGLMIYGAAVVLWLWVLSRVELSIAYPFIGLSFVITLAFSVLLLNESVNSLRILGTLLIAAGCIFVAQS